jgi:hypothetical protein
MDPNQLISGRPVSRRKAIGVCGAAAAGWFAKAARAQASKPKAAAAEGSLRLEKELENSRLIDISADSRKLCFYYSRNSAAYSIWNEKWQDTSPVGGGEDSLRIVMKDSWKTSYAKRLLGPASRGGFFAGADRVYVETVPVMGRDSSIMQRMVIDLQTGKDQQRVEPVPKTGLHFSYWPLEGNRLLGEGRSFDTSLTEVIVLAELPDYREIKRMPFLQERGAKLARRDGTLVVSTNRKAFAYFYESEIVFGLTGDLTVAWMKKMDPAVTVWDVSISPTADFAALYMSETQGVGQPQSHYVQVLNAKDGSPAGKIPVEPLQSLAVSPGGRLVAAALRDAQRGWVAGVQPGLQVFDVASAKRISTLVVDQFKAGNGDTFPVTAQFTSDAGNLLTSARTTKVWYLE